MRTNLAWCRSTFGVEGAGMRVERFAPASTGLLIASIIFANKLWIMDATSISLYWVVRLPTERSKERASLLAPTASRHRAEHSVSDPLATAHRRRRWKLALSLAIVGALAAPFVFRTYKARPEIRAALPLEMSDSCRRATSADTEADFIADYFCRHPLPDTTLIAGVYYEHHPDWPKYLAMNVGVAAATFVSVFVLALLVPMLIRGLAFSARRYWKWLNA
jgi:hypothetical protein